MTAEGVPSAWDRDPVVQPVYRMLELGQSPLTTNTLQTQLVVHQAGLAYGVM